MLDSQSCEEVKLLSLFLFLFAKWLPVVMSALAVITTVCIMPHRVAVFTCILMNGSTTSMLLAKPHQHNSLVMHNAGMLFLSKHWQPRATLLQAHLKGICLRVKTSPTFPAIER